MPSGSPCPATPIANPPTDNTSRIMRADCRSLLVNWAIIRFSQASRCRSRANYDARTPSGNSEYNDKWMSEVPRAEVTCSPQSLSPVRANSEVIELFRPLLFRIVRAALIHINIPAHVYYHDAGQAFVPLRSPSIPRGRTILGTIATCR